MLIRWLPLLMGVLFALLPERCDGCSCGWSGPFSKVVPRTDLVVWGTVLKHEGSSLELRVIEVLLGQEDRKTIRVWGDNGILCRPYVTTFPVETEWVFALNRVTSTAGRGSKRSGERVVIGPVDDPTEKKSDYAISICGAHFLQVADSVVVGRIAPESSARDRDEIRIDAFRRLVADLQPDSLRTKEQ